MLMACFSPSEKLGDSRNAIWGGSATDDNTGDLASADIVVSSDDWLGPYTGNGFLAVQCTAVFVTPTRLLTANHCITGGDSEVGGDGAMTANPNAVDINAYGSTTPYSGKSVVSVQLKGSPINHTNTAVTSTERECQRICVT